ncbi:MAG: hypothetical protein HOV92_37025 [Streptomyces sp.]|nr:hypothetical protein [Streptomyces sp.]
MTDPRPAPPADATTSPLRPQLIDAVKSIRIHPELDPIVTSMIMAGAGFHITDDEAGPVADAVLAVMLPTTRLTAMLHRNAEADLQRVTDLYEAWCKAGPPPLGTSIARWWDTRLIELRDAILPPDQQHAAPNGPRER